MYNVTIDTARIATWDCAVENCASETKIHGCYSPFLALMRPGHDLQRSFFIISSGSRINLVAAKLHSNPHRKPWVTPKIPLLP